MEDPIWRFELGEKIQRFKVNPIEFGSVIDAFKGRTR